MANSAAVAPQTNKNLIFKDVDYEPVLSNWYTSKPYGFRFTPKNGTAQDAKVMYLPINPSNLSITTHFATNLITTIYGDVEEHSPVRYFDIAIEGTTGIGPKYTEPISYGANIVAKSGRSSFAIQQNLGFGLFSKTINTVQKIFNEADSLVQNGKLNASTGLQLDQTGYTAFHNLYRFLLAHKKDVAENPSDRTSKLPPLVFFNFKDGNEYSVVIKTFTLKRDKENPMLYYYSIVMRGYHLTKADGTSTASKGDQNLLENLGLSGIKGSPILGQIKTAAAGAKDIFASVANGVNQLGR